MLTIALLAAALGQVGPDAGATAGAPGIFPYPEDVRTLKNGLKVVMVNTGKSGLVAYDTLVRVGSRNEVEEGRSGFAHFFEHMMFRGTDANPPEKFGEILKAAGVEDNAFTTDDFTCYTEGGPSEALPTIIALEADRFQNLKYSKEAFQTESKAVLGEYSKDVTAPGFALDEALHKASFIKSPYRHTTMGFVKDIKRMPEEYAYSLQFFKRWYVPANTTIVVAGDFDPNATFALIEKAYGSWSGQLSTVKIPVEPEHHAKTSVTLHWATQTLPRVVLGYHAPSLGTDLKAAAIQNLLGPYLFGKAGALYRSLVLDQHLVESMDSWYWDHRDPSLFAFGAEVKDEASLPSVQDALEKAVAQLAEKGPDAKLLDDVKSNLHYGLLMGFETPNDIAQTLAAFASPTGEPGSLDQLAKAAAEVTPADVQRFAQTYLIDKNETVVVLRPPAASVKGGQP